MATERTARSRAGQFRSTNHTNAAHFWNNREVTGRSPASGQVDVLLPPVGVNPSRRTDSPRHPYHSVRPGGRVLRPEVRSNRTSPDELTTCLGRPVASRRCGSPDVAPSRAPTSISTDRSAWIGPRAFTSRPERSGRSSRAGDGWNVGDWPGHRASGAGNEPSPAVGGAVRQGMGRVREWRGISSGGHIQRCWKRREGGPPSRQSCIPCPAGDRLEPGADTRRGQHNCGVKGSGWVPIQLQPLANLPWKASFDGMKRWATGAPVICSSPSDQQRCGRSGHTRKGRFRRVHLASSVSAARDDSVRGRLPAS